MIIQLRFPRNVVSAREILFVLLGLKMMDGGSVNLWELDLLSGDLFRGIYSLPLSSMR